MDLDGVEVSVVYPASSIFTYVEADRGLAIACMRAYNDWILDDFQGADPKRLVGLPMLPVDDGADLVERGLGGEFLLDHQPADEVDTQVKPAREGQPDREHAERERQPERPAAQPNEIDIGVVGDEFQEAHVGSSLRCSSSAGGRGGPTAPPASA